MKVQLHGHRFKSSLNEKNKNFIPDKNEFKQAKSSESTNGALSSLHQHCLNYAENMVIGHPNLNSIRNKLFDFKKIFLNKIDICLISENKFDDSIPNLQFFGNGYKLFRRNRNRNAGGLILHVKENIPFKLENSFSFSEKSKIIALEFSISNTKWLLLGLFKPPSVNDVTFIDEIKLALNDYTKLYENFIFIGDFDLIVENSELNDLMNNSCLKNLIKWPTCYKSNTPACIDLILTNQECLFMKSSTFESGLSDFHKLTTTIFGTFILRGNSKKIFYKNYKSFRLTQI